MSDKKQGITHVPRSAEVTRALQQDSSGNPATLDDATPPVTPATLVGAVAELRIEISVIVE
jgi:hypothetical protein